MDDNNALLKRFGANVERLRVKQKYSTRNFSNTVGIDPSTLYRIEIGQADPQLTTIVAIAKTLNVKIEDLVNNEEI